MPRDETELYPYSVTDLSRFDALIIAPHPDDESLGCGGSIIKHINSGSRVKVIFLTDGGSGDFEGRFGNQYVDIRKSCAQKAMSALGVKDYEFWGYRDRHLRSVTEDAIDRLKQAIMGFSPSLIYVPSLLEIHPDHKIAGKIGWRIFKDTGLKVVFYEVLVPLYPNILVDITSEMSRKKMAIESYHTELHYNDYLSKIVGLNRFRTLTLPETITFAEGFILLGKEVSHDSLSLRLLSEFIK